MKNHELKLCEIFYMKNKSMQCFKCYDYEHFFKNCKNENKCDHCAANHRTNVCDNQKIKYVTCEQSDHKIGIEKCSIKQKQKTKIIGVDTARSLFYTIVSSTTFKNRQNISITRGRKRGHSAQEIFTKFSNTNLNLKFIVSIVDKASSKVSQKKLTEQWKTVFQDKVNNSSIKRTYTHIKIMHKKSAENKNIELGITKI